jgi:FtsZ-interacting cell division protein YlmF
MLYDWHYYNTSPLEEGATPSPFESDFARATKEQRKEDWRRRQEDTEREIRRRSMSYKDKYYEAVEASLLDRSIYLTPPSVYARTTVKEPNYGGTLTMKDFEDACNSAFDVEPEKREDLLDAITYISPEQTPLVDMFKLSCDQAERSVGWTAGPEPDYQWSEREDLDDVPTLTKSKANDFRGLFDFIDEEENSYNSIGDTIKFRRYETPENNEHDVFWASYLRTGKLPFTATYK